MSSIFSSSLQRLETGYCLLELVIALQFDEPRSPDALFFPELCSGEGEVNNRHILLEVDGPVCVRLVKK